MVAGSIVGCVEHMAMFPVDTMKTRMHVLRSCPIKSVGVRRAVRSILHSDSPARLYRGIAAMALGAGPAHAVYFSVYEFCKKTVKSSGICGQLYLEEPLDACSQLTNKKLSDDGRIYIEIERPDDGRIY